MARVALTSFGQYNVVTMNEMCFGESLSVHHNHLIGTFSDYLRDDQKHSQMV